MGFACACIPRWLKYLFPLFQWHACKLAKLSACIAKCMTTINKIHIYIFLGYFRVASLSKQSLCAKPFNGNVSPPLQAHFNMKSFARGLVWYTATMLLRKWCVFVLKMHGSFTSALPFSKCFLFCTNTLIRCEKIPQPSFASVFQRLPFQKSLLWTAFEYVCILDEKDERFRSF